MPIFYLEPRDDATADPRWAASAVKEGCWVTADSEGHARERAGYLATTAVDTKLGAPHLQSPWLDPKLTDCSPSTPNLNIRDKLVTVTGKTFP